MPKLLFFSGTQSTTSINAQLARLAEQIAAKQGAQTTFLNLCDYELPLYDPENEKKHGIPDNAKKLKALFQNHDGAFIASPEYNGSFTPVLKNTIDWMSRVRAPDEPFMAAFLNKVYAIGAVSPGALGGMRGLVQLRMLLNNINIHVVPSQIAVGESATAFNNDGELTQDIHKTLLHDTVTQLVTYAKAHHA